MSKLRVSGQECSGPHWAEFTPVAPGWWWRPPGLGIVHTIDSSALGDHASLAPATPAMSDDTLHDTSTSTLGPARGGPQRPDSWDIFRGNYPPAAVSTWRVYTEDSGSWGGQYKQNREASQLVLLSLRSLKFKPEP